MKTKVEPNIPLMSLTAIPLLAYAMQPNPFTPNYQSHGKVAGQIYALDCFSALGTSLILGAVWFSEKPAFSDVVVFVTVLYGMQFQRNCRNVVQRDFRWSSQTAEKR
jgi:hypothetical protein